MILHARLQLKPLLGTAVRDMKQHIQIQAILLAHDQDLDTKRTNYVGLGYLIPPLIMMISR